MTQHVDPGNTSKIERAFWKFHREHPEVYNELCTHARQLKAKGYRGLGMKMLFEVLRWERMRRVLSHEFDFKLNNNYTAYYARLIMHQEPDLAGVFKTRELGVPSHVLPG